MIWMDVDTALASVPVNAMPLISSTDFVTIQDAVVYNQAGLALFWNFTTTAGVTTVTAITPTTSGTYDWTDFTTSGMYGIEIPASGGASINNDTEGFGHFTGVATGILPWAGPIIGFRAAALNNSLVDAGTTGLLAPTTAARTLNVSAAGEADADVKLWNGSAVATPTVAGVPEVDVTHWIGTAVATPTVAGVPEVDMTHLVGVAQSATDLKDFADDGYDPTTNKVQGVALVDTVTTVSGDVNGDIGGSLVGSVQGNVDGNVAGDLGGDVVGNVQGNVNGSVGSVAGDVAGNLVGDIGGLSVGAAADFFLVNSGQTYGTAIAGSVVKEIADNATVTGTPNVNVTQISGDSVAADNLETALDGGVFNVGGGGVIAASVTGNVGGNVTGSVGSVAAGGITAASIATGAIDADALATDAVNEIADGLLGRNVAGGSSIGRTVKEALYFLRNKWTVATGTLTVYETDDATPAWTASVSSDAAADPIIGNDPS